jgi:hypothetical protein
MKLTKMQINRIQSRLDCIAREKLDKAFPALVMSDSDIAAAIRRSPVTELRDFLSAFVTEAQACRARYRDSFIENVQVAYPTRLKAAFAMRNGRVKCHEQARNKYHVALSERVQSIMDAVYFQGNPDIEVLIKEFEKE